MSFDIKVDNFYGNTLKHHRVHGFFNDHPVSGDLDFIEYHVDHLNKKTGFLIHNIESLLSPEHW